MVGTTLTLPAQLYSRLNIMAHQRHISTSQLAEELLSQGLVIHEKHQTAKMYKALNTLKGKGKTEATNLSATIDQTLYGEKGA